MKYIRTSKGWIIQKTSLYKIKNNHLLQECECGYIDCGEVIAQADTIEELVDDFVAKTDNSKPFVIKRYEIYSNLQFGFTIYGAIWTDKGLIYVAKMNEKGELELL